LVITAPAEDQKPPRGATSPSSTDQATAVDLDLMLDQVLASLEHVAAEDSLCTLTGARVQAAKYFEGQVVALKELRRIRRTSISPEADNQARLALIEQWSKRLRSHERSDLKWQSYLSGGRDALTAVS